MQTRKPFLIDFTHDACDTLKSFAILLVGFSWMVSLFSLALTCLVNFLSTRPLVVVFIHFFFQSCLSSVRLFMWWRITDNFKVLSWHILIKMCACACVRENLAHKKKKPSFTLFLYPALCIIREHNVWKLFLFFIKHTYNWNFNKYCVLKLCENNFKKENQAKNLMKIYGKKDFI